MLSAVENVAKSDGVSYLSPVENVPNKMLSHIFALCSCGRPIQFPYPHEVPYQVTISQVCSRWRQLALNTGTL